MTLQPRHEAAAARGLDALGTLRDEDERAITYAVNELLYHPHADAPRDDRDKNLLADVITERLDRYTRRQEMISR